MPPSDDKHELEELLRRAAGGDEDAWRDIVEVYGRRVFGLIRAQCGNADLAEEITQSAFCTVAAKIGSYTELGRFEAWLFRIAMNRLRDEMRRRKRQARPMENTTLTGLAGADDTPHPGAPAGPAMLGGSSGSLDEHDLARLHAAVARLSDAEQKIIHFRHNAELSFKQIAEQLDQPLGTVLARHHRALKKLKEFLTPLEDGK